MSLLKACALLLITGLLAGSLMVYSGVYDIGADAPHLRPVFAVMEMFRERAIAAHAKGIVVPPLDDPALLAEGAEHYAAMCGGCHLAPGESNTALRAGLYPQPPNFSKHAPAAAEAFWVIKHGIKMTAMPAWGRSHNDQAIWGLVAFVRQLPELSPTQYTQLTGATNDLAHHHRDAHDAHDGDHVHRDHDATQESPTAATPPTQ
jgi:mono/diheme cytochrome c family protein